MMGKTKGGMLFGYLAILLSALCANAILAGAAAAAHTSCANCHTRGGAIITATVTELCLTCHPDNAKDHLLGVTPKTPPPGLPLDRDRKMTCVTCHEPHGKGTAAKLLRMDKTSLCAACHPR